MTALQIRPATGADAGAIAGLLTQLGYPTTVDEVPGRLGRLTGGQRAVALVAERRRQVVGLATAHILSVLNRPRDVAWLTILVVDETARGSGIGRALVAAVEDFARREGCERLSVTTQQDRLEARAFYPRIGLEENGRRFGKMLP